MSSNFLTFLILSTLLFIGCKEKNENTLLLENMHNEVMQVHDDVMPQMSTTRKLKKELRKSLKEIKDGQKQKEITMTITALEAADESMMVWMEKFKKPDYTQVEIAKAYYNSEMDRINHVKDLFESSMASANGILQ